jgi:hypothetical protein
MAAAFNPLDELRRAFLASFSTVTFFFFSMLSLNFVFPYLAI